MMLLRAVLAVMEANDGHTRAATVSRFSCVASASVGATIALVSTIAAKVAPSLPCRVILRCSARPG